MSDSNQHMPKFKLNLLNNVEKFGQTFNTIDDYIDNVKFCAQFDHNYDEYAKIFPIIFVDDNLYYKNTNTHSSMKRVNIDLLKSIVKNTSSGEYSTRMYDTTGVDHFLGFDEAKRIIFHNLDGVKYDDYGDASGTIMPTLKNKMLLLVKQIFDNYEDIIDEVDKYHTNSSIPYLFSLGISYLMLRIINYYLNVQYTHYKTLCPNVCKYRQILNYVSMMDPSVSVTPITDLLDLMELGFCGKTYIDIREIVANAYKKFVNSYTFAIKYQNEIKSLDDYTNLRPHLSQLWYTNLVLFQTYWE